MGGVRDGVFEATVRCFAGLANGPGECAAGSGGLQQPGSRAGSDPAGSWRWGTNQRGREAGRHKRASGGGDDGSRGGVFW